MKAGEKSSLAAVEGTQGTASDWQMTAADIHQQMSFPAKIVTKRPDIVLWSRETRQVILLNLTVPWENRIYIGGK